MKVTAFIGGGRKRHSYNASEKFLKNLQSLGDIEYEIIRLSDFNLGTCKGCRVCFGFNTVKGCCIKTLEPMTEKAQNKFDRVIARQSKKFYDQLIKARYPSPSLMFLMAFRMGRTSMRKMLDESWRDYTYYRDKGWFKSDYFYPVKLDPFKKLAGKVFDKLALQIIRS